jgi:cell division protein FtsQ
MADFSFTALRTRMPTGARSRLHRPPPRRLPLRVVAATLVAVALLAGGWAWLRQSSLVAVQEVTVNGLTTSEADVVRKALTAAGRGMSTLAPREAALRAAVAPYASVAGIEVRADFPHALHVQVRERLPVALLAAGQASVPVAGDGRLLEGVDPEGRLPVVQARQLAGGRIADARALDAVTVIAAAPGELHFRVRTVEFDSRGLVLDMFGGPDLVFGDTSQPRAKWAAAARVLAEPSAAGAVYLDLRIPERVAAGGLGPVDPATADTATEAVPPASSTLNSQVELEAP